MKHRVAAALCLPGLLWCAPSLAHHGKDFLIVEGHEIPHPGDLYLTTNAQWEKEDGAEVTELEPSVLVGISSRIAGELHGHFVREPGSDSYEYEAIAPAVHVQLTDPHADAPVHVGISAEYEFGEDDAADAFEARLIFEKNVEAAKATVNIFSEHVAGEATEYGYAAGLRLGLNDALAAGLESQGSLESTAGEGLAALYCELGERFTVKLGLGTGYGDGPDAAGHLGLVFRF